MVAKLKRDRYASLASNVRDSFDVGLGPRQGAELTLNALTRGGGARSARPWPSRALECICARARARACPASLLTTAFPSRATKYGRRCVSRTRPSPRCRRRCRWCCASNSTGRRFSATNGAGHPKTGFARNPEVGGQNSDCSGNERSDDDYGDDYGKRSIIFALTIIFSQIFVSLNSLRAILSL